jgi:signal transduction histidine kinase
MKWFPQFGKYGTIIISIALFLVFDLGVLVLNFYVSSAISKDAVSVNLAGRQRMLSQRTVKALLETQIALKTGEDVRPPLEELRKTYTLFDGTLRAFQQGGEALGGDGQPVQIEAVQDPIAQAVIAKAYDLWTPYREKLLPLIEGEPSLLRTALPEAVAHARANNVALLGLMNEFTTALEKVASAKADRLRLIQVTGISLALINFLVILFHFIRHLRASDALAEAARQETQDILESVSEGLFLLDRDGNIGHEHSQSLETIFQGADLAHRNFLDVLRPLVSDGTLQETADYLGILFREHVNLKLVATINPLDQVQAEFRDSGTKKYLAFQFTRVHDKHRALSHVLVTVKDVTEQVLLSRQLEQSKQLAEEQMTILLAILHIDPESLRYFLDSAEQALKKVNQTLRQYGEHRQLFPKQYRLAILDILPIVHGAKGEAALLGLTLFEKKLHAFEDLISELRGQSNLGGEHLLSLTVHLDRMLADVQTVREMVDRLVDLRQTFGQTFAPEFTAPAAAPEAPPEPLFETAEDLALPIEPAATLALPLEPSASLAPAFALPPEPSAAPAPAPRQGPAHSPTRRGPAEISAADNAILQVQMQRLVKRMAEAHGKQVDLVVHGFDALVLSNEQKAALREVLTQLLRNAVVHGIETPAERAEAGKQDMGVIRVQAKPTDEGCRIICHDDGRGISGERLREAAIRSGLWAAEELAGWDEQRLRALLFEPGLSTADSVTLDAGRGVGMDVVKERVEALNGQLALSTQPGQFCAWSITLPSVMALDQLEFQAV